MASGNVQVDGNNRINVVWVGSENTGIARQGGKFVGNTRAVKVVLHFDQNKIHGYPIDISELKTANCVQCGKSIPY